MKTLLCLTALTLCFSVSTPAFAATRQEAVDAINTGHDKRDSAFNSIDYAEYRIDEFQFYIDQATMDGMPGPFPSLAGFEAEKLDIFLELQSATGSGGHMSAAETFLIDGDNAAIDQDYAGASYFYGLARSEGEFSSSEADARKGDAVELVNNILTEENAFLAAWVAWQESQQE